ncbi:MAG: pantetheine-phosphate adenylyltransferase [archaeon]
MTKALYAFSGDPITYGHINVVEEAAELFEHVTVAIGVNPDKKYLFTLEERTDMATHSLEHIPNVTVTSFQGLLVDYACKRGINVIVKGIRDSADFEYELKLYRAGKRINPEVKTVLLFAKSTQTHVSSSMAKAILKEQGFVQEYVPLYVKQRLEEKMLGQYIVGITGEIGCGKSYVAQKLVTLGNQRGIQIHNIEVDDIGHAILSSTPTDDYEDIRKKIAAMFPGTVLLDGSINRKALGEIVFDSPAEREKLDRIMYQPLQTGMSDELRNKKGIILLNAALLAESQLTSLCNNNVILVCADKASQLRRMKERGLTDEQIRRRLESQYDSAKKKSCIDEAIAQHGHGTLWTLENNDGSAEADKIALFEKILYDLKVK